MVYNSRTNFSLEESLSILERYSEEVEQLKKAGGMYFNGCADRARRMQKSFAERGMHAEVLVATCSDFPTLEHESGTLWYHHYVLYSTGLIYDPNYRRKSPVEISEYPILAFPKQNVSLWKIGEKQLVWEQRYAA